MSIGETLARARADRGMTIEEVSAATRVRQTLIRGIEGDDYSLCGGDFYARGHIRNFAHTVGADPAPLLAEFDSERSASPTTPRAADVFETETRSKPERRGPNWSAAMAFVLVLVCAYGAVRLFSGDDQARPGSALAGRPDRPAPTASSRPQSGPSPSKSPGDAVAAVPRDRVTVRMTAKSGGSWVSVTGAGGRQIYRGLLDEGRSRNFVDKKQVKLVVGDAGAVRLVVNGKGLGAPGRSGEVVRLAFGPGDPAGSAG